MSLLRVPLLRMLMSNAQTRLVALFLPLQRVVQIHWPDLMNGPGSLLGLLNNAVSPSVIHEISVNSVLDAAIWRVSTFKRRRTKMNRHKLKKRRKKLRLNTKISRS
jgi:hypothetical protein